MNIGRWPKLLAITTSSLGKSAIVTLPVLQFRAVRIKYLVKTCGLTQFGGKRPSISA